MLAGHCLRVSPPTDGSKLTHQTAPRSIADIADSGFGPGERLSLPRFVLCHVLIGRFQLLGQDMWTHQIFDKAADLSTTNDSQESVVDGFVKGDGPCSDFTAVAPQFAPNLGLI